jgi:hypothetical protein
MPSANRQLIEDQPRYTFVELVKIRRQILRYARSLPPGPERNQHWQVAVSLRRLFNNEKWRDANTVEGPRAAPPHGVGAL